MAWLLEAKIFDFRTFWDVFSIQIDVKLKLIRKTSNLRPLQAGGPSPEDRPFRQEPDGDSVLATFF